eukprot:TRINITY_DN5804_c0_g1_i1.p1 TRINITY_DN5804_c0_g1~~TRINITY_DN5804_c0_g1_i1.p1  ORF type:complete len:134 (+),score=9.42 TRINITY_DN5804_c0_g1_i1:72-473(+)
MRDLNCQPRPKPKGKCVSDAKMRNVLAPQRVEVVTLADTASAVHLGCFAVELGKLKLRRGRWVGHWDLKAQIKLVLEHVVDEPALAEPLGSCLVRLNSEPIVVALFVDLYVLNQRSQLLFQALRPPAGEVLSV